MNEIKKVMMNFQKEMMAKQQSKGKEDFNKNKMDGDKFLETHDSNCNDATADTRLVDLLLLKHTYKRRQIRDMSQIPNKIRKTGFPPIQAYHFRLFILSAYQLNDEWASHFEGIARPC